MADHHTVQATPIDGAWVLTLPNALGADIEPELLVAAAPAFAPATRLVVLDLTAVQYANSAGIGALVVLLQRGRDAGIPVRFAGAAGQPLVVLDRVGLAGYGGRFATVREALEAV